MTTKDPYLRCIVCGQRVTAEMDDKRHCELIEALERSRNKLRAELNEYKELHERSVALVFPGERDTPDSYLKILRDAERECDKLRTELAAARMVIEAARSVEMNWKLGIPYGLDAINSALAAFDEIKT